MYLLLLSAFCLFLLNEISENLTAAGLITAIERQIIDKNTIEVYLSTAKSFNMAVFVTNENCNIF